ncbi:MAG: alpha/beta hydrolase family protein [Iamia sp.]
MNPPIPPVRPRPTFRRRGPLALALAAALLVAACGSGGDSADATTTTAADAATTTEAPSSESTTTTEAEALTVAEPGTYAVGSDEATVVDDSRVTDAKGGEPELPERTLETLVLYPTDGEFATGDVTPDAEPADGPWPMVLFSHGNGGSGPAYAATLEQWASAGYVVVAPTYPLTSLETPNGPFAEDLVNQPADVSVLLDWATGPADGAAWTETVDTERIGLSGHSLGGFTSLAVGYNPCCADDRVDAVAEWAGAYLPDLAIRDAGGDSDGGPPIDDGPPLLIIHGDADETVPYENATQLAEDVGAPSWLVTLVDGPHTPPYVQGFGSDASTVVTSATLDFFDQFLKGDPEGTDRLAQVVTDAGPDVATLEVDEG